MSENSERIKSVFKLITKYEKLKNKLQKALEILEWPLELFFMSLTNEIIIELEKINTDNQTPKSHKRMSSNISNNSIYLEKKSKLFLYQMINVFDEIKDYKNKLPTDIINYIITPDNINKILHILMATNKITTTNPDVLKELNEFNSYIMNLLINIINLNNKILIDVISTEKNYNVFYQLFVLFSKNEENRGLLYDLERNIFLYYPDNNNLKDKINYTIGCIQETLNKDNCKKLIGEIKIILFLYKNDIHIISKLMTKLIINIFSLFENEIEKQAFIKDFLKFCFNEICFDGNNKYYDRYVYKSTNKSKAMDLKNNYMSVNNSHPDKRNGKTNNNMTNSNKEQKINDNAINNFNRMNTTMNFNTNKIENKNKNNENVTINTSNTIENNNAERKRKYNIEFMNFLLDIYNELINLKLKKSYSIVFIEFFLSINNSSEGRREYSFLIKKTNFIKIILPSLIKVKDESLIAAYFSKIIFLSIPTSQKTNKKIETDCYIPEVDLQYFFDNMNLFIKEDEELFTIISSQIVNLLKMNKSISKIILNKCNIYNTFFSIIQNDQYSNEIKRKIIDFLEKILSINNNVYKYKLEIPITTYNISDSDLIIKLYSLSLTYENNSKELSSKIVLIINYMYSLFEQNKFKELLIFLEILLEGICKNVLNESNFKIIDDEAIKKINDIIYDLSLKMKDSNANFAKIIISLLKFESDYNRKFIINNLNKKKIDYRNKLILEEKVINKVIKSFFVNAKDFKEKIYLIKYIIILCIDINNKSELINNINDEKEENNYFCLLKAPNLLVKIIEILFEIKEYKCLDFIINKIIYFTKYSPLNIKILFNSNNNLMQIIIKLIIDISHNKDEEKLYIKINMLLNDISKYLPESLLIQYLSEIYFIFYTTIDPCSVKSDTNTNKDTILELFHILKNGIISSNNNNYDYLSLSKYCFCNPYVYNLFYIKELKLEEDKNIFLCLNTDIRISSYNNIGTFRLVEFINEVNKEILSFTITKENKLQISEQSMNNHKKNLICEINKINEMLIDDGNFHKVSIIVNTRNKKIFFEVDQEKIHCDDKNKNNCKYSLFDFNEFDIIMGYRSEEVCKNTKSNKMLSNLSIIDVKNIMITKFNNLEEYNSVINKKKENNKNENLVDHFYKNKKYFDYKIQVESKIIFDINFKNKNINIKKSNKVKDEIKAFNSFLSNKTISNKFISYYEIYFPFNINTVNNYCSKIYMLSLVNNIEEYYILNNHNNVVLFNLDHKYIQSKIFDNYNTAVSACNYYIIDFLMSFFFDIEKRRNAFNKNNNSKENQNEDKNENKNKNEINETDNNISMNNNQLNDNFLNDCIIIIIEIIIELSNEEIIDYFLNQNNIISIKLKVFFYRNIYLFNKNNEFIQKVFETLEIEQKSSKLVEDNMNKNNEKYFLVFITEIFLDLLFFKNLNFKNQNYILMILIKNLSFINYKLQENALKILFKLLKQIYNIFLYYQLSLEEINYQIGEEKFSTQIDLIIKVIDSIFYLFEINDNIEYTNIINDLNRTIINLYSNYDIYTQNYHLKEFNEGNKNYMTYSFLANNNIYNQIQKIVNSNPKFKQNNKEDNTEIKRLDSNDSSKDNTNLYFCAYIKNYFKLMIVNIYNNIKFDKIMDDNYINLFLNFDSYRKVLGTNNFGWFLSRNESSHKMQNKFFLKKNDIKQNVTRKANNNVYSYEYIYDKEKHKIIFKSLYELFLYDRISADFHLIRTLYKAKETQKSNKNEVIENCLYIKYIHKILSVLIIEKEYILILTNLCVDNNLKLHVVKSEIDTSIWSLHRDEYEDELEKYITKNQQEILKEYFSESKNKNKQTKKSFGYNNSHIFSYKKIYYKNIAEMHRMSYLTIPNSIEIFMTNGKSYFICLNMTRREKIFMEIIARINDFYKSKETKIEGYSDSYLKKSSKNLLSENFYLKHCPITYLENNSKDYSGSSSGIFGLNLSIRKKSTNSSNNLLSNSTIKITYSKALVTVNTFLSEVCDLWTKNKISNYDYIMLLNILSGRSLNNLSQYFIFPRLLNDFNHTILNWISSAIYRDLSYPILSSEPSIRDDIKRKYDLNEEDKYHSGTFYSTYAFVAYFSIRQRPFTEISLEIQGGQFDSTDRLFSGTKEICGMKERYQESIPLLITLPELYVNTNKFNFGKAQNDTTSVNDFGLPNWSKNDPRKFILVMKKIFESKNVNIKLNKWIDLIFGVAQSGPEAVKCLNTYRKACYELSFDEIEDLRENGGLLSNLIEKQELGYNAKQIFKKFHKKKENINEFREYENIFFDTNLKLRKIQFEKINNIEYNKEKEKITFKSINDFVIDIDNDYINDLNIKNDNQGGIASLKSIIKALNENNGNKNVNNPLKLIRIIEKVNNFIILGNGYHFLGKNYDFILSYKEKYLEIFNFKLDIYYCYYLNESNSISTLVTNDKGNKIYVAFNNGNILEYKVVFEDEEFVSYNKKYIYPIIKSNTVDKLSLNYNQIYMVEENNFSNHDSSKGFSSIKRTSSKKVKKKQKPKPIIALRKNIENNFIFNNPHIPEKIVKIQINEDYKILIAVTVSNIIYLISLNNKFKLMHKIIYYNNYKYQYKIKDIIPLPLGSDFIIYSSMTVHLFSINGVPLCELNLLDKVHESLSKITCCVAAFLYDVILFTGHEDSSIVIWKVKNKNTSDNFKERISYLYNNNSTNFFLNEYYYNYDFDLDDTDNSYNIQECELLRKFEIVSQIKMKEELTNLSINYMKMSQDMSYMIILDDKKDIYLLSNFYDYKEENSGLNSKESSTNIFGYFKEKKIYCASCCKEIEDTYYRASRFQSISNIRDDSIDISSESKQTPIKKENESTNNSKNVQNDKDEDNSKDINYICEECKLKLINTESYLYNY